jgi:hypothetical protein
MKINKEEQLQNEIIKTLDLTIHAENSFDLFKKKLIVFLNELINHDFEKLIYVLYKVDVSEKKLKNVLSTSNADAASILADLIIERQLQKMESRRIFKKDDEISDEEKW